MKYGHNVTGQQNVHGCKETNETEKLYYEAQKIKEMEIEEIKRDMQASQRNYLEEREEEKLEHTVSIKHDEHMPSVVFKTEEETEIHQYKDQNHKLREKLKVRIIRRHK
jgi:hypothetical protein